MDDLLHVTLLYDFYGELLTQKQKLVFEMYYQNDLSLTEIGDELSISRQAVRDQLKRTEKILAGYEEKLNLVERFMRHKKAVEKMKKLIEEMEAFGIINGEAAVKIEEVKRIADEITG